MPGNSLAFPVAQAGLNYSRFGKGEFGANLNGAKYVGTESLPEAKFQVAPGSPTPTAFSADIGNQIGPGFGLKTNPGPVGTNEATEVGQ